MPKKTVKKVTTKKVAQPQPSEPDGGFRVHDPAPSSKAAAFRERANALRIGSSTGQPTQEQHENLIIAKTLDEVANLL